MQYCNGNILKKLGFINNIEFTTDNIYKIKENKYFVTFHTNFAFICTEKEKNSIGYSENCPIEELLYKLNYSTLLFLYNLTSINDPIIIYLEKILSNYKKLKKHTGKEIYNSIKNDIQDSNIDRCLKKILI